MSDRVALADGAEMAVVRTGDARAGGTHLVWAHGWGQTGAFFRPLAESFGRLASSHVIDFPGFGASPVPSRTWGTEDYADALAPWLATLPSGRRIWIGHSFGCRVGLQIAARHPGLLSGMVLIAAAGLPRRRSFLERLRLRTRVLTFKLARRFLGEGPTLDRLRARFGSADYRNAGSLRAIFVKVVNEDLAGVAPQVSCPTLLIYGNEDHDTPPEIGERLARLVPQARLVVLDGFDHLGVVQRGRHQVAKEIRAFVETV